MRGGMVAGADLLIINAVISFYCSGTFVGFYVSQPRWIFAAMVCGICHYVQSHFIAIFILHCIQWLCTIALYFHLVFRLFVVCLYPYIFIDIFIEILPYTLIFLWEKGKKDFVFRISYHLILFDSVIYIFNFAKSHTRCEITLIDEALIDTETWNDRMLFWNRT